MTSKASYKAVSWVTDLTHATIYLQFRRRFRNRLLPTLAKYQPWLQKWVINWADYQRSAFFFSSTVVSTTSSARSHWRFPCWFYQQFFCRLLHWLFIGWWFHSMFIDGFINCSWSFAAYWWSLWLFYCLVHRQLYKRLCSLLTIGFIYWCVFFNDVVDCLLTLSSKKLNGFIGCLLAVFMNCLLTVSLNVYWRFHRQFD